MISLARDGVAQQRIECVDFPRSSKCRELRGIGGPARAGGGVMAMAEREVRHGVDDALVERVPSACPPNRRRTAPSESRGSIPLRSSNSRGRPPEFVT
jgi:hypothetical protein